MQKIENRFRSGGIGNSEIVNTHLYPNRWDLVNPYWGVQAGGDMRVSVFCQFYRYENISQIV